MAQKVVIDVEARFIDNVSGKSKVVVSELDRVEKEAGEAKKGIQELGKEVEKTGKKKPVFDADSSRIVTKLRNLETKMKKMGLDGTKSVEIIAKTEKAATAIGNLANKVQKFVGEKHEALIKIQDSEASKALGRIIDQGKGLAGKTWSTLVKIKDFATTPLTKIKNMLFSIKSLVLAITAGVAAKQFILNPINLADQYSGAKIGFSTLLGAERGQAMMDEIDAFAKATPFKTSGVIANVQKMMAYGWDVEKVIDDMKTIGDAAAATGKGDQGLESIVYALSEIRSKGKLSTQELNQLASAGIKAKAYLAEGLGFGTSDEGMSKLAKALEKGQVGANQAIDLILEGMKEFNGMMDKTANETVEGLMGQLEDTFEINIFRRWGQGLQDGAKRGLGSVVQLLDQADAALMSFGDTIYEVGKGLSNYFADVLDRTVKRIKDITESDEFKNADLGGKIKMLWEGAIANPFADWWEKTVVPWWDRTAVPWLAEKAAKMGKMIGTGLTQGLLALFGVDVVGAADDGANIAGSFVRGFLDGFDGAAITDAFVQAINNVWSNLPSWAQILIGGYGAFKGMSMINSVVGGVGTFLGNAKTFLGTPGTAMMSGTGLSSWLASAGYALTGGAAGSALTGTTAALVGGAGAAGGLAAGVSAISGINDLVNAYNNNTYTEDQKHASKMSGVYKISGAAIGAAIGSAILPGIGTMIGAGLGGGLGWFTGNREKKAAAEKATMAELEAQKESNEAMAELERRQGLIADHIKESFGSMKLTTEEIKSLVDSIVLGKKIQQMNAFKEATSGAELAMQELETSTAALNKWNWKASLGYTFSDADKQGYLVAVQNYIASAEQVVEAQHYKFTAAVDMLLKPDDKSRKGILKSTDAYFASVQKELDGLETKLTKQINLALKDGKIDPESEAKVIADLQNQIAEITNKIANAQAEAKLEALKIKFGSGQLDYESFQQLQKELQTQMEAATGQYDTALETSITTLKLELDDGAIDQAEYDKQIKALTAGYTANVDQIKANASSVQFEILGDSFENVLGEDGAAKLQQALEKSLADNIQPVDWTQEQAANYLGVPSLTEQSALTLGKMLSDVAATLPESEAASAAGNSIAESLEPSEEAMTKLGDNVYGMATGALKGAFEKAQDVTMKLNINVQPTYTGVPKGFTATSSGVIPINQARGGLWGTDHIPGYRDGGMVQGGAKLIRVAEEGDPEMIIPLGSQRRERGMKLWEKAGQMLGVPGFARGGLTTGGDDEGLRFTQNSATAQPVGGQNVQVEVGGITVEVNVDGGSGESIGQQIRAQAEEIAETVAGVLYDAFSTQFENTPVRGGA